MKLNPKISPKDKDTITSIFFYEKDKIPKEYEGVISTKELKKYGTLKLIRNNKSKTLLVGLGKKDELTNEKARRLGANMYNALKNEPGKLYLNSGFGDDKNYALMEGLMLSTYEFNKYKTEKEEPLLKEFNIIYDDAEKDYKKIRIIVKQVFIARNLVNEPSSFLNPKTFIDIAKKLCKGTSLELSVLDKKILVKKNMGAILAVGSGSDVSPAMIIIKYTPNNKSNKHIALVGKGVTFDAGGYNIKPTGYIEEMKQDMGGAATVLCTILAANDLKIKKNIIAYIPLVENLVSGNAYKPGDVIRSYSKKTIEVVNTDAEGRLILADALYYAQEHNPELIMDFATLTGTVIIALGPTITGVMTNRDEVYKKIFTVSKKTGEKVWQLPIYEEHDESIKADVADIKNIGFPKGAAGTMTAGAFLKQFVNKKPWIHFDIGGTAFSSENKDYIKKGGTGVMIRTMVEWLMTS